MNLGKTIVYFRKINKWSQEELAKKLFLTRQAISNYERNLTLPSLDLLHKMSELFHITLDELTNFDSHHFQSSKKNKMMFLLSIVLVFICFIINIYQNFQNIGSLIGCSVITFLCGGQFYFTATYMMKHDDYSMLAGYKKEMNKTLIKKQLNTMIFYSFFLILAYNSIILIGYFIHFDSHLYICLFISFIVGWFMNLLLCSFKYKKII